MQVDPTLGVPLHIQLERQLVMAIEDGRYPPGAMLPSLRALAGFLRINRNTVARCYLELESEGWLRSAAGRGFFVREDAPIRREDAARRLAEEALDAADAAGVDPREVALLLLARAQSRAAGGSVAFVECTLDQTQLLARDLSQAIGMPVAGIVLSDALRREPGEWQATKLVVTTFHHAEELEALLSPLGVEVHACLLQANLDTLHSLSELPDHAHIGIACTTAEGTAWIRASLRAAGFTGFEITEGALEAPGTLPGVLEGTELVVCPKRVADVLRRMRPGARIIIDDQGEIMPRSAAQIASIAGRLLRDGI